MSDFPLQAAKVQRPALRAETLQRDRLLGWLNSQADARVILVTAEAGYGKTTLLADFSRRTRRRVLWYRIDDNDRSWVSLVRYLVASGQEVEPEFGAGTQALLDQLGTADGPGREAVVETLIREYATFGAGGGAILILDDYHQVDDVPEIRAVLNQFIGQAPDRLTIVLAGRRTPGLALARLRSLGALVELSTDDLRFDLSESEQLFRETYGRQLDPDLLAALARRLDGWAACLQLVQSALRNRPAEAIREFIAGLSGASGDLHDYLAEEVVGNLEPATQTFLMRLALLQSVYPRLAAVIGEVDDLEASRLVADAERAGLLGRRSDAHGGGRRYHPLVQEFLEGRLRREFGDGELVRLHRLVANHASESDWRLAAHHFAAAGDIDDLHRLVEAAVPRIMAGGEFAIAESFIDRLPDGRTWPIFDVVLSRMELARDRPDDAVRLAESAVAALRANGPSPMLDQALANLMSMYYQSGQLQAAAATASRLVGEGLSTELASIARATVEIVGCSVDGALDEPLAHLREMAAEQSSRNDLHYLGITQVNIGEFERTRGDAAATLDAADEAIAALNSSSAGHEIPSARVKRAWALAHQGDGEAALRELEQALHSGFAVVREETQLESASVLANYFDSQLARNVLGEASLGAIAPDLHDQHLVLLAELDIVEGRSSRARDRMADVNLDVPHREVGFKAHALTVLALAAALNRDPDAIALAKDARELATSQGAGRWSTEAEILIAALDGPESLDSVLRSRAAMSMPWLSVMAELFLASDVADPSPVRSLLEGEVRARPDRWRASLRRTLREGGPTAKARSAALLDLIGEARDVHPLRQFSKQSKSQSTLGRSLARRVAQPVFVRDLGRVNVTVGLRTVGGESIRRKVLALLCYLITRPGMAAARDQVVDALWPDQDPTAASNSLNQTVYFLRRVFEPRYVDDLSPGYVRHETDLIWLDPELVSSQSERCRQMVEEARRSSDWSVVAKLSDHYAGRFALDFEYEEWATDYRDNLHASYLEVIELAVKDEIQAARFERAIQLCRRALDIDPSCDAIERQLLRLYKSVGSHAAAEQQYRHYAAALKDDLGVAPPPLSEL